MLTIKLFGPINIFTSRRPTTVFRFSSHMCALNLLLVIEDSSDDDVLESLIGVQSKSLRDGFHSFGSEIPLSVHVHDLSSVTRINHNMRWGQILTRENRGELDSVVGRNFFEQSRPWHTYSEHTSHLERRYHGEQHIDVG